MSTLIVQNGKHKGKKIALPDKEIVIGRDEGCFVRLGSTDVSRRHCALVPTSKGLLVRDLKSQNGTIVNDAPIDSETLLQPGDVLQIGTMQFQLEGARPAKPAVTGLDDDIAGWLSDSATDIPASTGDTTIISAADLNPQPAPAPKPEAKPKKPTYASTADEARDIIQRHFKSRRENE